MRRHWRPIAVAVAVVVALAYTVAYLIDEPLRGQIEGRMNAALTGYRVQLGAADFHPLNLGLDLRDLTVVQEAAPDPPLAHIEKLAASVHWRALVFGGLVADLEIESPRLHVDRRQAVAEARDEVPVQERGWQQAVEAIYPLEINQVRVTDGELTYIDSGPAKPLRMTGIDLRATNIRNVRSPDRTYPSEVYLVATLFDRTPLSLYGHADFMAEPYAALNVRLDMQDLEIDYLKPVLSRYNLDVRSGRLSVHGALEYGPQVANAHLENLTLRKAEADWVHTEATAPAETERVEAGVRAAQKATKPQNATVRIDTVEITDSTFGYHDRSTDPPYRIFLETGSLTLANFSNQLHEGKSDLTLRGALMGTGSATVDGTFRPETHGPDFDVATRIESVDMAAMNDLWRAYAGVDVARGVLSVYSELAVKNGRIEGYVKPLFQDIDVYDPRQDEHKSVPRKVYEGVVGGVANLFENRQEDSVATRTNVSGTLENPNTSTLQVVLNMIRNAFFESILPGLDRHRRR